MRVGSSTRRYTVQEKEMTVVVHCLRVWRHYLLGSRFMVKTSYFQTQKKLSPKQAQWQDFLAEFDYVLEYKSGRINLVADALSRKAEFAALPLLDRIKEGLAQDPTAKNMMEYAKEGKTWSFWLEGDLLYTKGRRLYVLLFGNLRRELLKEYHDS